METLTLKLRDKKRPEKKEKKLQKMEKEEKCVKKERRRRQDVQAREVKKDKNKEKESLVRAMCLFGIGIAAFLFCMAIGIYGYRESKNTAKLFSLSQIETTEQVQDVTRVMETIRSSAADMEDAVRTIDSTIDTMQDSIVQIQAVVPEDVDLVQKMDEMNLLSSEVASLEEELLSLESRIEKASREAESGIQGASEETVTLSKTLVSAKEEITRITQRIIILQDELETRRVSEEELSQALQKAGMDLSAADDRIRSSIQLVSDTLEDAEGNIEFLKKQADDLEAALLAASAQLQADIETSNKQLQSSIETSNRQLESDLRSDLDTRSQELQTTITNQYNLYTGDLETLRSGLLGSMEALESRVDTCFQSVSEGKASLASALTDEGTATGADASFPTIADSIHELSAQRYENGYNDGYAMGFQKAMSGAYIDYTYHEHTGSSASGGGCYSRQVTEAGYYTYQTCNSSSFTTAGCYYQCTRCGSRDGYSDMRNCSDHNLCTSTNSRIVCYTYYVCANGHYHACAERPSSCNVQTSSTYHPGRTYYALGCGKTEETIETATLHFE